MRNIWHSVIKVFAHFKSDDTDSSSVLCVIILKEASFPEADNCILSAYGYAIQSLSYWWIPSLNFTWKDRSNFKVFYPLILYQ